MVKNLDIELEEETLSDLRIRGIKCLREMKERSNKGDKDSFDFAYSMYKNSEREYHALSGEMFPDRMENKYMGIMIESENVFS